MRPLKFRAWAKGFTEDYPMEMVSFDFTTLRGNDDGSVSLRGEQFSYPDLSTGPLKIMQFTGLLDKNGKEVYEGDILRIGITSDNRMIYAVCNWITNEARFGYDLNMPVLMDSDSTNPAHMEVIGNIHEHPHLLQNQTSNKQPAEKAQQLETPAVGSDEGEANAQ